MADAGPALRPPRALPERRASSQRSARFEPPMRPRAEATLTAVLGASLKTGAHHGPPRTRVRPQEAERVATRRGL